MTTEPVSSTQSDPRASKRTAIGLAPTRPTAKARPQRPPRTAESRGCAWSMVLLVTALVVVTLLLVSARMINSPLSWLQVRALVNSWQTDTPGSSVHDGGFRLLMEDEFSDLAGLLPTNQQTAAGTLRVLPDQGVYQLQIEPDRLAWSTVGAKELHSYNAEANFTIASSTPNGSGGFVARYQDSANFYLFAFDGQGQFQVQLLKAGVLQTLTPWLPEAAIQPNGQANRLALIDDGVVLRFFVNGPLLYEVTDPQLPAGDVGVFGAGTSTAGAEVNVDWLRIYALPADYRP